MVLLIFGAKRIPEIARGVGSGIKEFKNATQDVQDDFREAMDSVDPQKSEEPAKKAAQEGFEGRDKLLEEITRSLDFLRILN